MSKTPADPKVVEMMSKPPSLWNKPEVTLDEAMQLVAALQAAGVVSLIAIAEALEMSLPVPAEVNDVAVHDLAQQIVDEIKVRAAIPALANGEL
uniref:Uncharacterized protein n=1 Tax=Bosea sp. NBC_00436 TaxID=2969620 RepID=A0A9E7ZPP9_9HYPH